ncbi:FAD-dependent monooxygenase [Rhizobium johnstonii]|uniref:FAD-dependent monooxygenase n=1 Tax=Rhizobium TaxID=379 RepID=UPI00140FF750|nr:FAD-dependent monooxygenase [Rhizobium leguminosarum]QIO64045.1 NAD(P)-binding protein [Rhizobium leguminosarum bv. trifolii]
MTTHANTSPILVVGGGIGGTSTAIALAKKGIRVRIFEQAPELREAGVGIQMPPNAFRMFERLGVLDEMLKRAAIPKNLVFMDAVSGDQILHIPIDEEFISRFDFPYAMIHRGDLLAVLANECYRSDLIEVTTSTTISQFEETKDGVTVIATDGRRFEGTALIAADGLWSKMRDQIIGPTQERSDKYVIFRGVVPVEAMPKHDLADAVVMWGGPNLNFSHYPVRGGTYFALGASTQAKIQTLDEYREFTRDQGEIAVREAFAPMCEPIQRLFDRIDFSRMWKLYDREPVKTWTSGKVALLGDAAHPSYNYMAQGACMALEDAVTLADLLSGPDADFASVFKTYEEARYVRTARVQLTSRFYGDLYHSAGVSRDVRNTTLSAMSVDQLYDHLSWLYAA